MAQSIEEILAEGRLTSTQKRVIAKAIRQGGGRPYKVFAFLITQTDDDPVLVILENEIADSHACVRTGAGQFELNLNKGVNGEVFTEGKSFSPQDCTVVHNDENTSTSKLFVRPIDVNNFGIETRDFEDNTPTDGGLYQKYIEIRVYDTLPE